MKNIIRIVFFFAVFSLIGITKIYAVFSGGNGSSGSPYHVANLTDLNDVRYYLSSYFIQTDDISIGFNYNTPLGWLPIGDYSNPFTGYYDGNGFVITAMKIDRPNTDYIGLFGYTYRAVLKNITINDSEINGNDYVGLLVGYFLGISADSHYIDNCFVHAVSEGHDCVGGLAGYVSQSKVIYSAASADVTGNEYVGGLIGMCKSAEIEYCDRINEKSITGGGNVGGLVGLNDRSSSIINCRSQESLVFGETNVGGLVGWNYDKSEVLSSSTQGGTVTSTIVAGGLVGRHEDDAIIDDGCYTTSCVVTAECMAGGLIGISSYAIVRDSDVESTDIIADYCLGGLIGHEEESYIADCSIDYVEVIGGDYVGMMIGTDLNYVGYANNYDYNSNIYYTGGNYGNPFGAQTDCPCNSKKRIMNEAVSIEIDLQIYPNPAKDYLQINSKINIENIKIINALGQIICCNKINAHTYTINTSDYNAGVYFIQLEMTGKIINKRFIIGK